MSNKKYVVWKGKKPGIYNSWPECQAQVNGFSGAKYKSFPASIAQAAFKAGPDFDPNNPNAHKTSKATSTKGVPTHECLTVDAAYGSKTTIMEWRGVMNVSRKEFFRSRPFKGGSNNIGEFLALVDGIRFLRENNLTHLEIYTDSQTALAWIRSGKCNTTIDSRTLEAEVIERIKDAEAYLKQRSLRDIKIKKWDTPKWGIEIPADFGRK